MASESVEVEFETVDQLPGGRVVLPLEAQGNFTWQIVKGHMRERAQAEMRDLMRKLIVDGHWMQKWNSPPAGEQGTDARNQPEAEGGTVTVEVRIVDELPGAKTVDFEELPGYFAWLILRGNITEQARVEMEAQMQYLTSNRQWEQELGGSE